MKSVPIGSELQAVRALSRDLLVIFECEAQTLCLIGAWLRSTLATPSVP
jgi:hypothetical protein